jgi:hypothetical protein
MEDRLLLCMTTSLLVADLQANRHLVEQSFSDTKAFYVNRSTVEDLSNKQELVTSLCC